MPVMATIRFVPKETHVLSIIIGGMYPYLSGLPKRAASIKSEQKEPLKLPLRGEIPQLKPPQFGEYCRGS